MGMTCARGAGSSSSARGECHVNGGAGLLEPVSYGRGGHRKTIHYTTYITTIHNYTHIR